MYGEPERANTIYAARIVRSTPFQWKGVQFPADVVTRDATMTVAAAEGRDPGTVGAPDESRPAALRIGMLRAPIGVTVEVTRWSAAAVEVAVRPPERIPFWVTEDRYVRAVSAVLDRLVSDLSAQVGGMASLAKSA
jgi:hypothetical protein